jgi:predicted RNA-binding Zn ribbon-like protein
MGKNVLVVSTVEDAEHVLRPHFAEDDTLKVVVPVTGQGILDWLASDEKAFSQAEQAAERTAERLPGETVEAVAGEANVGLAIRDALATFPAHEIVVAVRPDDQEGLVESIATEDAPRHTVDGVPVRFVVVPD